MKSIAEQYKTDIFDLWGKNQHERAILPGLDYVPLWYSDAEIQTVDNVPLLLFVSLNPSFSETTFNQIYDFLHKNQTVTEFNEKLCDNRLDCSDKKAFYNSIENIYRYVEKKNAPNNYHIALALQHEFRKYGSFFKPVNDMSELIQNGNQNIATRHIDLFAYRHTEQHGFKKRLYSHTKFFLSQFDLALDLICNMKPSCVVVLNAFASRLFAGISLKPELLIYQETMSKKGIEIKYDKRQPNQSMFISERHTLRIPIFFSSQLSGGASDVFSQHRLAQAIRERIGLKQF